MDFFFSFLIWIHVIAGFTALFILWVPLFSRKGSRMHNTTGWIFVVAMGVVALSAFSMGVIRILNPLSEEARVAFSWFLIYISILSSTSAFYGIKVLNHKNRKNRHKSLLDFLVPINLLLTSFAISAYGFTINFGILKFFPILGLFISISQLLYWSRPPKNKKHWMIEHLSGMLGCCIATITAFTVFGGPRILHIDSTHWILWFLPTIIFTPFIFIYSTKIARKSSSRSTPL